MKEDKFFLGQLEDKLAQCSNKYITTETGFLDGHQQALAMDFCRKNHVALYDDAAEKQAEETGNFPAVRAQLTGGYADAERNVLLFLPDYAQTGQQQIIEVIRATKGAGSRALTHRDYLGSLVGLGIKRELIGDILVREDGADILVLSDIADFLLMNYTQAGRTTLSLSRHRAEELLIPEQKRTIINDTVASLRLDCIVASAFGLSRGKAAEAIARGLVFVNHVEVLKSDAQLTAGDKITLRGKGKACLSEIGGRSRKDRQYITLEKY